MVSLDRSRMHLPAALATCLGSVIASALVPVQEIGSKNWLFGYFCGFFLKMKKITGTSAPSWFVLEKKIPTVGPCSPSCEIRAIRHEAWGGGGVVHERRRLSGQTQTEGGAVEQGPAGGTLG